MAPHAVDDYTTTVTSNQTDITNVKIKSIVKDADAEEPAPPPVADSFMYDFKYNHALPTSDVLGIEIPQDCDAQNVANDIVNRLSDCLWAGDAETFAGLFLESGRLLYSPNAYG
jgi:hypothetical protein